MTIYSKSFWRLFSIMSFVLVFAVQPAFCIAPIVAAGLIAGAGSLIGGLVSLYGTSKGGKMQAQAQREANAINQAMAEKAISEDKRQFDIASALQNMKFRLYKDELEWTQDETLENKNFNRAFGFANRLVDMANGAKQRGLAAVSAFTRN